MHVYTYSFNLPLIDQVKLVTYAEDVFRICARQRLGRKMQLKCFDRLRGRSQRGKDLKENEDILSYIKVCRTIDLYFLLNTSPVNIHSLTPPVLLYSPHVVSNSLHVMLLHGLYTQYLDPH